MNISIHFPGPRKAPELWSFGVILIASCLLYGGGLLFMDQDASKARDAMMGIGFIGFLYGSVGTIFHFCLAQPRFAAWFNRS